MQSAYDLLPFYQFVCIIASVVLLVSYAFYQVSMCSSVGLLRSLHVICLFSIYSLVCMWSVFLLVSLHVICLCIA